MMGLLVNIQQAVAKNKNDTNVPKLEIVGVILIHCNFYNDKQEKFYQQARKYDLLLRPGGKG